LQLVQESAEDFFNQPIGDVDIFESRFNVRDGFSVNLLSSRTADTDATTQPRGSQSGTSLFA